MDDPAFDFRIKRPDDGRDTGVHIMTEAETRETVRLQYRADGSIDPPKGLSLHERWWWADECFKIVREEYKSSLNESY